MTLFSREWRCAVGNILNDSAGMETGSNQLGGKARCDGACVAGRDEIGGKKGDAPRNAISGSSESKVWKGQEQPTRDNAKAGPSDDTKKGEDRQRAKP